MTFKVWQDLIRDSDAGRFAPERAEALIEQGADLAKEDKAGDPRGGEGGTGRG